MDGVADLPAAIPGSEQVVLGAVRGDLPMGSEPEAGDRRVLENPTWETPKHWIGHMSQLGFFTRDGDDGSISRICADASGGAVGRGLSE